MYLNPTHSSTDAAVAAQIVREQPLASLITTDDAGLPKVSHLPMHLIVDGQGGWTLYADMARVPTWSYVAVHCRVRARLIDAQDLAAKDALLKTLIADHDPAYAAQWRSLDPTFQPRM